MIFICSKLLIFVDSIHIDFEHDGIVMFKINMHFKLSSKLSFLKLNSYLNTKCLFIAFSHAQFCFSMRNFVFEVKTPTCACEKAIKKNFAFEYEFSLSESLYLAHNEWYVRKLIMDTLCSTCTQQIEIIRLKDKLSESLCTIPYFHWRWNMKTHKTSL